MKYSRQREAILAYLRSTRTHPSADKVYENIKGVCPNISLGTVYRNLAQLVKSGEILRLDIASDRVLYDGFTNSHCHFICNDCGRVFDFGMPELKGVNERVADSLGVGVEYNSIIFYGRCSDCGK